MMKRIKNNTLKHTYHFFGSDALTCLLLSICVMGITSCDFVEVDPPKNTLVSETVFEDPATVRSALANIYVNMRDQGMVSGKSGASALMGMYSDELDYHLFNTTYLEWYQHTLTGANTLVLGWWNQAYHTIYAANDIIRGVENAKALTAADRALFKGEALFVRAYMHSLLAGVFGDIPYITTTNYIVNNQVARMPIETVYELVIKDLTDALPLLEPGISGERVLPNQDVAQALLARMYLYTENWDLAAATASLLIDSYTLEPEVTNVFLKNASETLWQFKPNGVAYKNTYEANEFIIRFIPGQVYAMTPQLVNAFEPQDLRRVHWVGSFTSTNGLTTLYFPYKYKAFLGSTTALEYSIVFRLSEQYLIRAEARAHLNQIAGAQADLNAIRNRAGLPNTTAASSTDLLTAILQERQVELFTEHGQRWFDLKRSARADAVLSPLKTNWKPSDVLLPIPDTELEKNPHLKPQNAGY